MPSLATLGFTLQYTAPGGPVGGGTASQSVASSYTPQAVDTIDIPDATALGTVYPVDFGTVDAGAAMIIKNKNSQDMGVRINEKTATGVLVAGTLLIDIDNVVGDHLSVALVAANGDAGTVRYWVFRVSNTQVRVVAADSVAYGFVVTSVASVKVYNDGQYSCMIPAGGFLAMGGLLPAAVPLKSASVITTGVQASLGILETFVFGPT